MPPKQVPTFMLSTMMVEAHLLPFSLAVRVLQNSLRRISVGPKINPLLSPLPVAPVSNLVTGDHDLVPPPGNLKLDSSN